MASSELRPRRSWQSLQRFVGRAPCSGKTGSRDYAGKFGDSGEDPEEAGKLSPGQARGGQRQPPEEFFPFAKAIAPEFYAQPPRPTRGLPIKAMKV